ncbi:MAG: LysM peptidoglycan-binding domain-containing protein [Bacillus sp. (in: firmicutes)]
MKKFILAGTVATSLLFSSEALAADYTVKSGDSLWSISQNYNVTVNNLKTWNNLISDVIYPGQVLKTSVSTNQNNSTSKTYTVVKGDTLGKIAKKFNTTVSQLQALNPSITNVNVIHIGQVIKVSGSAASTTTPSVSTPSTSSWEKKADAIINTGKKYLGAAYLYGASPNQTDAFDCSSFTQRVFAENGITLPRTSVEQSKVGQTVSLSNIRKGDLIFFDTDYNGVINHVSIVVDSSTILHSASSKGVSIASYNSYWKPRAVKAVRLF